MTGERCADGCVRRDDTPTATAPPVRRWVLVELPGAWGPDPLRRTAEGVAITAVAGSAGARVLFIRRPGRTAAGKRRRWAFADSTPGQERILWSEFDDPAELADVRLDEGVPSDRPVYLVCTHGKHDLCCAVRGRPVAAALAAARPEDTWECSHVGGDRFAANLLVLPHGLYYGRLDGKTAVAVAEAHERGLVLGPVSRGRSSIPAPAQAAEHFARGRLGEDRLDRLSLVSVDQVERHRWQVRFTGPDVVVDVKAGFHRADGPLTCAGSTPGTAREFELVSMSDGAGSDANR
ncbi:sucrase ferredoxin [Umezawaea sp. Da 62-37]|uniref:sucrase ferredoxin n=1 Tax=Umezawaea sp. Da 62-37 TaxID=3075927 RepID=UPI0028F6E887|nr:sucrase ferredoxin [Umezawaea sp. Da 62-37]WNV88285.1 sucrase ferredoxin [Umezawaea sp. Da 62-37]